MVTSFCQNASIHSVMRLTHTHTYHHHRPQLPWLQFVAVRNSLLSVLSPPPLLSSSLLLSSPLSPFLSYLFCLSLCLCHDESGRGSDRHSTVSRATERSLSTSSLNPLPSLPPPLWATAAPNPLDQTPKAGLIEMWDKGKQHLICVFDLSWSDSVSCA